MQANKSLPFPGPNSLFLKAKTNNLHYQWRKQTPKSIPKLAWPKPISKSLSSRQDFRHCYSLIHSSEWTERNRGKQRKTEWNRERGLCVCGNENWALFELSTWERRESFCSRVCSTASMKSRRCWLFPRTGWAIQLTESKRRRVSPNGGSTTWLPAPIGNLILSRLASGIGESKFNHFFMLWEKAIHFI